MRNHRPRQPKPILPALASATVPSLIKHLASCNTTVRSQSFRLIQSWLLASQSDHHHHHLSHSDVKKLWKGLFYCLWHSDKSVNQLALIDRLTSLFLSLHPSLSLEFFRGFLLTLRREWPGIDRLRLDKFYLLIRRFVKALFELMRLRNWDARVLGDYFGVLESDALLAADKLQGNGVNYHLVSVFLEELKSVGFPVKKKVLNLIFRPFFAVMKRGEDKILLGKVRSCLFDELLKLGRELLGKKKEGLDCDENGDALLGLVALRMKLSKKFYEVGSSADCVQGNRKIALGLQDEFLKLEKDLKSSGIEISVPEYCYVDQNGDDGVPQLIPMDFDGNKSNADVGEASEGAEVAGSKKCSKMRKKGKRGEDGDAKKRKKKEDGNAKKRKKKEEEEDIVVPIVPEVAEENGESACINDIDNPCLFGLLNGVNDDGTSVSSKKKKKKKERKGDNVVPTVPEVAEEQHDSASVNAIDNDFQNGPTSDLDDDGESTLLNETVILNLQKQFEKVAAEMDSEVDEDSEPLKMPSTSKKKNKRKRTKGGDAQDCPDANSNGASTARSADKSAKRVRFSMKNNIVWKPQTPLPPESLRLPPSVTPRGSALKKGLSPGPVIEMLPVVKKSKKKKKKKIQKRMNVLRRML